MTTFYRQFSSASQQVDSQKDLRVFFLHQSFNKSQHVILVDFDLFVIFNKLHFFS